MIKTHKKSNPARIITSGSGTAVENLSIFVENVSSQKFWKKTQKYKTRNMLNIVDDLKSNGNLVLM